MATHNCHLCHMPFIIRRQMNKDPSCFHERSLWSIVVWNVTFLSPNGHRESFNDCVPVGNGAPRASPFGGCFHLCVACLCRPFFPFAACLVRGPRYWRARSLFAFHKVVSSLAYTLSRDLSPPRPNARIVDRKASFVRRRALAIFCQLLDACTVFVAVFITGAVTGANINRCTNDDGCWWWPQSRAHTHELTICRLLNWAFC